MVFLCDEVSKAVFSVTEPQDCVTEPCTTLNIRTSWRLVCCWIGHHQGKHGMYHAEKDEKHLYMCTSHFTKVLVRSGGGMIIGCPYWWCNLVFDMPCVQISSVALYPTTCFSHGHLNRPHISSIHWCLATIYSLFLCKNFRDFCKLSLNLFLLMTESC